MGGILERISQIAENEGITITSMEAKIGASKGVLSRALAKKTDIQSKWVIAIVENYPRYNTDWLITGKGAMEKTVIGDLKPHLVNRFSDRYNLASSIQSIPLYDITATAGVVSLFKDVHQNEPIDYIQIPNIPKCDGAVPIRGDSMYPLLKSGDIVLYKECQDKTFISWGEMYLVYANVNGDDYFAAKWIQRSEKEGFIKLVSQNAYHQPVDIPIDSVRNLALIKASIRINASI